MFSKKPKAFQAFINAVPKPHKVSKFEPPKLKRKTESYRTDVMLGEADADFGIDELKAKLTFEEYDPQVFDDFGTCGDKEKPRIRIKASVESDYCDIEEHEWLIVGDFEEIDQGSIESGKSSTMDVTTKKLIEYQYSVDKVEKVYIDLMNGIERYNGIDRTAARRAAIGYVAI